MDKYLTATDKENLANYVRIETLEPCFKQIGKKDALPLYHRPTHTEVRELAKLIGIEGSALGLLVGADGRKARRWQSPIEEYPTYSQWALICLAAAKTLEKQSM